MVSPAPEDAAPAAAKSSGRYKHILDALAGKFYGFPDGIFAQGVTVASLLPFQGRACRYDLLTGRLADPPSARKQIEPVLRALDALHRWMRRELANGRHMPGDITAADFSFRVGEIHCVDLSVRRVYDNGEITRDATGHARVERIERTEIVPEWKAVPHLPFAAAISITARGSVHTYRDEPGSELRFFQDRG
jgi:hypothetical protein